jgi:hypothetical protein
MKDIRIHAKNANNLCSIKPIDQTYEDKIYLTDLFEKLYERTGCLYVELKRPNYPHAVDLREFSMPFDNL